MGKTLLWKIFATAIVALLLFAAGWRLGQRESPHAAPPAATVASGPAKADSGPEGVQLDAIRRGVAIDQERVPPPLARVENADRKRLRAYPMQPPTIPHAIDNYEVDRNTNRCLLCHARANAEKFQAPPVSVTHYMDREDQFLATISPRRYFCNQCHVVQTDAPQLVANGFKDIDSVLAHEQARP